MQRGSRLVVLLVVLVAPLAALVVVLKGCATLSPGAAAASSSGAPAEALVEAQADLTLTMEAEDGEILAGQPITHTLAVVNLGPDDAQGIVLTETLCCTLTYQAIYGEGWACEDTAQTAICELTELSSGQAATLTAVVRGPEEPMTIWAAAQVGSTTPDPNERNNRQRLILRAAEPGADVWLRKRASADPVVPGDVFSYTITVRNAGPDDAEAVVVTDTLPAEVDLLSVEISQGICSDTICSLGPFPAFGWATVTLTVGAPANEGIYTNTVVVRSDTVDQYFGNNAAHKAVWVRLHRIYLPTVWRSLRLRTMESD